MGELKTSIILNLVGNLQAKAQQFKNALGRLGQSGARSMGVLSRSMSKVSAGLDKLGNRYTALLTGAAGSGTIKMLMGLEERFVYLGIQANRAEEDINKLKKTIYETAMTPDIRVDPGEITSAIEAIVEKTGDLKFAEDNIRNIGLAIRATGAEGGSIGEIMAEFQKMGIKAPQSVLEAIDTLNVQGKEGAFTLKALAALGPRVVTAYTAMGRVGVPAIREMGAALQVIMQGSDLPTTAATTFEALIRTFGNAQKLKIFKKAGIQIFDKEELAKGRETLRPINEIIKDILNWTKGKTTLLSRLFPDDEASRAFKAVLAEFNSTGKTGSLDKFMSIVGDGTATMNDSARAAKTASAAMEQLYTAWKKFADEKLTEPIQHLAEALEKLSAEKLEKILKIGTGAALGLGGLVAGNQVFKAGKNIAGLLGKGGKAGALGGIAASMSHPIPVYVVNSRMSMLPNGDGTFGPNGVAGGRAFVSKAATAKAAMAPWLVPLAAMGVALAPAAIAGGAAMGSAYVGEKIGAWQLSRFGDESLNERLARNNVMGGGPNSDLSRMIWAELDRREIAKLEIEIKTQPGAKATVRKLKAQNMDVDVDTGPMTAGGMQ